MDKPTLRLVANLARAGGTLVSRCLGSMENIVLLSEIHPLGTHIFNPLVQAHEWYNLLSAQEAGDRCNFNDAMRLIEERCRASGRTLVIREWSHLDFIGVPFIKEPVYRDRLQEALAPDFDIIRFSLVRHPADQWLSTERLRVMQGHLDLDGFLAGYRRFAEQAVANGFMRYEDFTRKPLAQMRRLCTCLQLPFDARFMDRWLLNRHVTGDVSGMSRGSGFTEISPLKRRPVRKKLLERLHADPNYQSALKLLGYTDPQQMVMST